MKHSADNTGTPPYRGSCLCGQVKFEVDEFLPGAAHCHCSMCRKFHGAAFATFASVARDRFRWTEGESSLKGFTADNGTVRTFCPNCGSSVSFFSPKAPVHIVEIALGLFDDNVPVRPNAHIYVASGADLLDLRDNLPRFSAGRGSTRVEESQMSRVSTYLNFPGNTEEAFLFYRSVFGGDFNGPIHRFGEVPAAPGQPPLADADRNLVMHIELAILGGHVLMGTDATESMGFTVIHGNSVHINLEPDTRAETERLFAALSVDAKIDMPLQDMFWGACFGSLTDKFGIRWMVNCSSKT